VFIIPETFLVSGLFAEYIDNITILEDNPFDDTECPVCVVCFRSVDLFSSYDRNEFLIYKNDKFLFTSTDLELTIDSILKYREEVLDLNFNSKSGNIGLRGVDGISPSDRIRFCKPKDLGYDINKIKESSRAITLINLKNNNINLNDLLGEANRLLEEVRFKTEDVVFAPFKNNNRIGERRRRLDYAFARKILNNAAINVAERNGKNEKF
jgi:hypothetical protein